MKVYKTATFVGLIGLFLAWNPSSAQAQGNVTIGNYFFVCQNAGVVSAGTNGGLEVSDSLSGWVIMKARYRIPVPPSVVSGQRSGV